MRLPSQLIYNALLAASPKSFRNTLYVDGNNLMGHKGTPRDRDTIASKLQPIKDASSHLSVILVWDGRRGQESTLFEPPLEHDDDESTTATTTTSSSSSSSSSSSLFQIVSLAEGMSADDYILEELHKLKTEYIAAHRRKKSAATDDLPQVQVVTADRALRRQVLAIKPIAKGVINPVVFWKRYRPRLTGLKNDYKNEPKNPEEVY